MSNIHSTRLSIALISIMLISITPDLTAQHFCVKKVCRNENKVVYRKKVLKVFNAQRVHLTSNKTKGRLNDLVLEDTVQSKITDFKSMSYTIEKFNLEKRLCIDFKSFENDDNKPMSLLLLHNPFKKVLFYKAKIYSPEKKRYIRTKVLPIMPGISGIITWQGEIPEVIIYRMKLSKE